ncbi:MORC family CW-type zinc finger protein 3-like [Clarias gariepinus]
MAALTSRGIPSSSVSPQYLHSNSTSHTWPFSAIAELIDNAYDPDVNAKQLWINKTSVKKQDCLIFMDNGEGMDYDKMFRMLSFGFSDKQTVKGHVPVGLYGNGFKSGSMRLGKDAIVFSKKAGTMCVGLLSQTYLEKIGAKTVKVPIVTHAICLRDILTHSLFNTVEELLAEFSVIDSLCGTRIIIWNLRRTSSGKLEFDFKTDIYDIRVPLDVYEDTRKLNKQQPEGDMSLPESEYSLRAYCSILYLKPKMQIIIQGQKVEAQFVTKSLAKVFKDTYKPACLKKGMTITFGYNTKSKEHYGIMMYNKNRLIKAYERVACQRRAKSTGVGVIGVIECNYLNPTHNKQNFEDTEEYRKTMLNVGYKLEDYWKEVRYRHQKNNTECFEDIVNRPDQNWVQCDDCLKWRKLPDCVDSKNLPKEWFCHMNPDPQFRSCKVEEEPEDPEDEKPGYQKTYKEHERNQWQDKKNRLQQNLSTTRTSSQTIHSAYSRSSADSQDTPLHITRTMNKRVLCLGQEITQMKKSRLKDYDNSVLNSPSTSTALPNSTSPGMHMAVKDANKAQRVATKKASKDNGDVIQKNAVQSNNIPENQQNYKGVYLNAMEEMKKGNYKGVYLHAMEEIKQLQHKLSKQEKTEEELKRKVSVC